MTHNPYGHIQKSTCIICQRVGTFRLFRQHFKSSSIIYYGVGTFSKRPFRTAFGQPAYIFFKERIHSGLYVNMLALFLKLPTANIELSFTYISTCRHFLPLGVQRLTLRRGCTTMEMDDDLICYSEQRYSADRTFFPNQSFAAGYVSLR